MLGSGIGISTTVSTMLVTIPVSMRTSPTAIDYGGIGLNPGTGSTTAVTPTLTGSTGGLNSAWVTCTAASGLTSLKFYFLTIDNNVNGYFGLSAEL